MAGTSAGPCRAGVYQSRAWELTGNPERRSAGREMTAAGLCGSCGTQLSAQAKFCSECGTPIAQASPSAEYKQVTVLFAELERVQADVEDYARANHPAVSLAEAI